MAKRKQIHAAGKLPDKIIAIGAPVAVSAAASDGETKGPRSFSSTFYTGGALSISGWDLPVVVDLAGLKAGKVLVANLDHDSTKRVGNFELVNDGTQLIANGKANAATASRDEVVNSATDGYQWQASLEVNPGKVEELAKGKTATVNGQEITGPAYITRTGTLKGFGFVSHGADDNTTATIAASADNPKRKGTNMKTEIKAWAVSMGIDVDTASPEQIETIEANYAGQNAKPRKVSASGNPFEARKLEAKRRSEIRAIADKFVEMRDADLEEIESIEAMHDHAIENNISAQDFRLEMYESGAPPARRIQATSRGPKLSERILEAAICQAGRLPGIENHFSDQELQFAHSEFKGRIGLRQLFLVAAEHNTQSRGNHSTEVTKDTLRAAFNTERSSIRASGFSTLDIGNVTSATANKFIHRGWNMIDQAALKIAKIQPVNDFKTATTVSLTDSVIYEKVGPAGEIKHGTLSDLTYTNKADTYAKMLAITRQDIINDDLGALTDVPTKLGSGAMKKLNDIFWTEFLLQVSLSFFASGNANINTGVATMTTGGLAATETIFMNQTNPDGSPLGLQPKLIVVPTALHTAARTLMNSERLIDGTATATQGDANIWKDRFQVVSSPYISTSTYTGNTAVGWWMLADPMEMAVIAIAALFGNVMPTVDTAEADFNVLGVQMRGYSDVGVNQQEYRGGVYADGGAS